MARHVYTAEVASPALSSDGSFLQVPESFYSLYSESRSSLKAHTSYSGSFVDEKLQKNESAPQPKWSFWKFIRYNRFMQAFGKHPENPTFARRAYGIFHGHSFDTSPVVKKNVTGWKAGLRFATAGTFLVFFANSLFLTSTAAKYGNIDGMATLYSGDCNTVSTYDTFAHVLINVLSTILLGASSYVMQCLNSPSREQVDQAHAQGKYMDIGMPSFKNAKHVGWRQTGLWIALTMSALPLHVFWNSAVFSTLEANQYDMFVVPEGFNSTNDFNCDLVAGCDNAESLWTKSKTGQLDYLDNAECIKTYSANFLAGRRNLFAVTSNITRGWRENNTNVAVNDSSVFGVIMSRFYDETLETKSWNPTNWWCDSNKVTTGKTTPWFETVRDRSSYSNSCFESVATSNANELQVIVHPHRSRDSLDPQSNQINWNFSYPYSIDYCLSEKVSQVCQLQSANYVWLIVIGCNIIKLVCMFLAIKALGDNTSPLVVVGDAVASFLEKPDSNTEYDCLMSARLARKAFNLRAPPIGRVWKLKRPMWLTSAAKRSWVKTFTLCTGVLIVLTITFVNIGAWNLSNGPNWTSIPFGGVVPSTIIPLQFGNDPTSFSTLIKVLLLVNSPQILFSSLYFMYNSLLTSMLAMQEFSRFARRRRTLRVSAPVGKQRYTYWLQLPYTYSFPLLIASGIMHWFISESLYVARIRVIDEYGKPFDKGFTISGNAAAMFTLAAYSPKAVICALSLGGAMIAVIFGLGFRRHTGGVPFVGNNSLAISAACHPLGPEKDVDISTMPLMWGAVIHEHGDVPGHCSFSSLEVQPPIVGNRYA